ncbi:MAG TPA: hypothetical protein VKR59_07780 [Terriglobales bacterium]|nr:hypothetical protein [Terriglobales bacterium]
MTCLLDELFAIKLDDKGANDAIAELVEERTQEPGTGGFVILTFARWRADDETDTYELTVSTRESEWREQLWNDLSALRQLGFSTIDNHSS